VEYGVRRIGVALLPVMVSGRRSPTMMPGGWLLVSLPTARRGDRHSNDGDRARLLAARFAAGKLGEEEHRLRLAVLGDDKDRELGAWR
jgi:hypothetical protein